MVPLDILSDPICPWCYIGKRRLDQAMAEAGTNPFAIRWRMFRLNPGMPPGGIDRRRYLEAKFGGPEGAARVEDGIAAAARAAGLAVDLGRIARTPDTTDAHRLIRWAAATGGQHALVEELFRRFFAAGEDISDPDVLVAAAPAGGLEDAAVRRLLAGDADRAELAAEEAAARRIGVGGVPCFIIAGRHVLEGAQERATWARVIGELGTARAARTEASP